MENILFILPIIFLFYIYYYFTLFLLLSFSFLLLFLLFSYYFKLNILYCYYFNYFKGMAPTWQAFATENALLTHINSTNEHLAGKGVLLYQQEGTHFPQNSPF
jgi:hypothetical protein